MAKDVSLEYINNTTQKYKTGIRIVLLLLVGLLLTWVILKIVRAFKAPANAEYIQSAAQIPAGWDPGPMTDKLYKMIDGTLEFSGTMQDIYTEFNKLNDNQMIAVYNKWISDGHDKDKKYFMFPYGTLTNAIKDKVGYAWPGQNQKTLAELNLDRLKLS